MRAARAAYRRYLQSDSWKQIRGKALKRDGGKCVRCQSSKRLHVHHLRYRSPWTDTRLEDLETLCKECHKKEHWDDFEHAYHQLEKALSYWEPGKPKPPAKLWKDFKAQMLLPIDMETYGSLLWKYALLYLNWPRDRCRKVFVYWRNRAEEDRSLTGNP